MPSIQTLIDKTAAGGRETYELTKETFEALLNRAVELQNEIKRLKTPDLFWDADDPESGYGDMNEAVMDANLDAAVRLMTGKTLDDIYVTRRVITVDDAGDCDDHEIVSFDNKIDADKCWPESLAKAQEEAGL